MTCIFPMIPCLTTRPLLDLNLWHSERASERAPHRMRRWSCMDTHKWKNPPKTCGRSSSSRRAHNTSYICIFGGVSRSIMRWSWCLNSPNTTPRYFHRAQLSPRKICWHLLWPTICCQELKILQLVNLIAALKLFHRNNGLWRSLSLNNKKSSWKLNLTFENLKKCNFICLNKESRY